MENFNKLWDGESRKSGIEEEKQRNIPTITSALNSPLEEWKDDSLPLEKKNKFLDVQVGREEDGMIQYKHIQIRYDIINNFLQTWEWGESYINYVGGGQKYVLIFDQENNKFLFLSDDEKKHKYIHNRYRNGTYFDKYSTDAYCLWGWNITINEIEKTILLYDFSGDFWSFPAELHPVVRKILEKVYPWYTVIIQ